MRSEHVPEQGELTHPDHMVVLRSLRRMDEGIMFGEVHVRNLSFGKRVSVRYTLDFWQSYDDLTCHYLSPLESSYGIDRFGFHLDIGETFRRIYERDRESSGKLVRLTMIFAVRYVAENCGEWWDNNWGMNYEVELTRAPDLLGSGVGVPGHEPNSTAPGPVTSRGPGSAVFPSAAWLQPGTITPLWLTQPGATVETPMDSPAKGFWPHSNFLTGPLWGPGFVPPAGSGTPEPKPAPPPPPERKDGDKPGPVYTSIFFDTSLLPATEALPATSPTREPESPASPSRRSAGPSPFFADFTFETHLPAADRPGGWFASNSGSYSSVPTSQADLSANTVGDALPRGARSGNPSPPRRPSLNGPLPSGSPNAGLYEDFYVRKLREQGSWDDSGDWASARRRNLFGPPAAAPPEEGKEKRTFRTEVVDVTEYARMGGRSAFMAGRKG
ncbi:putative phosphatase regulatory subunit-domain-containing protein [Hyaloraphidium curvatum]|nr:putative phosphatase regulatory subunit-domain-containing protein [Hyaloraphidium curvatum]